MPNNPRKKIFNFKVTDEEHEDIVKSAGAKGLNPSEYVRKAINDKNKRVLSKGKTEE